MLYFVVIMVETLLLLSTGASKMNTLLKLPVVALNIENIIAALVLICV